MLLSLPSVVLGAKRLGAKRLGGETTWGETTCIRSKLFIPKEIIHVQTLGVELKTLVVVFYHI
jgi:hypothetical protein